MGFIELTFGLEMKGLTADRYPISGNLVITSRTSSSNLVVLFPCRHFPAFVGKFYVYHVKFYRFYSRIVYDTCDYLKYFLVPAASFHYKITNGMT